MNKKDLNKLLLKKQAELRRQGWDSKRLASYARGFNHSNFNKPKGSNS